MYHKPSLYRLGVAVILIDLIFALSIVNSEYSANTSVQSFPKYDQKIIMKPQIKKIDKKKKPIELPFGGRQLLPNNVLVALYGTPNNPALGVLGEQSLEQSIDRAKQLASAFKPHTGKKVVPTFEIITTVASAGPTENGDYSQEVDIQVLELWIIEANKSGVYVVLDLQPGHSDFLSQAKMIESLLKYPNVGLALDPEWRLKPGQVHMEQIGSVDSTEVNLVSSWLADLTKENKLPQKLFLVHQFRLDMITNSTALDLSRKELAYVIQMDGHGEQSVKQDTWNVVTSNYPSTLSFGWKNFIDEDLPMLGPVETLGKTPSPLFVSYQ